MRQFETRLIDPPADKVAAALAKAAAKMFDKSSRLPQLKLSPAMAAKAAKQLGRTAEGWEMWRSGRTDTPADLLVLAWWTDHAGRKHVVVRGRETVSGTASVYLDREAMATRPPLWRAFPEAAVRRLTAGGAEWLVACGCGAVGTPAAVGWMGDCCGPCHDRREEDGPAALAGNLRGLLPVPYWHANHLAFDPAGDRLAVAECDMAASVWPVRGSDPEGRVRVGTGFASDRLVRVAFSADGRYVAAVAWLGSDGVTVLDTQARGGKLKVAARWRGLAGTGLTAGPAGTVAFLDGDAIAVRAVPGGEEVRRIDYPDRERLGVKSFGDGPGHAVLLTPGGFDVIDLKTARRAARVPASAEWKAADTGYHINTRFAFHPRRKRLVVNQPRLEVYDTATGRRVAGADWDGSAFDPRPGNYQPAEIALSPDGRRLYLGDIGGRLYVLDTDTLEPVAGFDWQMGWVNSIAVSPDGAVVATGGECEPAVKVWPMARLLDGV